MNRINIFEDRKTERKFAEVYNSLVGSKKKRFSGEIKNLFTEKILSEEGAYSMFKITIPDIISTYIRVK